MGLGAEVHKGMNSTATVRHLEHIIALDFDGVLHPENGQIDLEFCFMTNFCDLLRRADPEGKAGIIVTSDWRLDNSLDDLRAIFPTDIAQRIVGKTIDLHTLMAPSIWDAPGVEHRPEAIRQKEIEMWLESNAPFAKWLAIDDRAQGFRHGCEHLFLVPQCPNTPANVEGAGRGLNTEVCVVLEDRLTSFFAPPIETMKNRN